MMAALSEHKREQCILQYFNSWISGDEAALLGCLAPGIQIVESYGPEYHGTGEVLRWCRHWNSMGQVLRWDALRFLHTADETVIKWRFGCRYDGNTDELDGLSLLRFQPDGLICRMEEYQSKAEHHRPYAL